MNKKISLGLALSLIAIVSAVTFILTSFFTLQSFNRKVTDVNEKAKKYSSLQLLDTYVRDNYYGKIDEKTLNDNILKGYTEGLDRYSRYLTEEEYQNELDENSGELVGLGLTLAKDESGYIRITEIMEGSPAVEAGLKENDLIIFVGDTDVLEAGFDTSIEAMRGTEGSEITLTVRRDGKDKEYSFTRRSIEVTTVKGEMLANYIGYIKISGFKKNTPQQFVDTLERLTSNGAKALLFDVRDNGGGLVEPLEDCLDPLLPEGIIAAAEYKDGHTETVVYSDESELDLPMAVLVNENTASSAELFASALRDFGKAQIIGMKTFGKGVIQRVVELPLNCGINVTIAKYLTPNGNDINKKGIEPNLEVKNPKTVKSEKEDLQLQKAIEVVNSIE